LLVYFAHRHITRRVLWKYELIRSNGAVAAATDGTVAVVDDLCLVTALSSRGRVKWQYTTEKAVAAGPCVHEDMFVFCDLGETLYAVGTAGNELWRATYNPGIVDAGPPNFTHRYRGGAQPSTSSSELRLRKDSEYQQLTITGDKIIICVLDEMQVYNLGGKLLWTRPTDNQCIYFAYDEYDDWLYVVEGNQLRSFYSDGDPAWTHYDRRNYTSLAVSEDCNVVFATSCHNLLFALNQQGQVLWTEEINTCNDYIGSLLACCDNSVLIIGHRSVKAIDINGHTHWARRYGPPQELTSYEIQPAYNARDCAVYFTSTMGEGHYRPQRHPTPFDWIINLFLPLQSTTRVSWSKNGQLHALSPDNGDDLWTHSLEDVSFQNLAVGVNGPVYAIGVKQENEFLGPESTALYAFRP
jgi:outer membrane protein assembly factor BamB